MTCDTTTIDPTRDVLADGDFLFTAGRLHRMNLRTTDGVEMGAGGFDPAKIDAVELQHIPLESGVAPSATIVLPADRILEMISDGTADVVPAVIGVTHAGYAALIDGLVASWSMNNTIPYRSPGRITSLERVYLRLRDILAELAAPTRAASERHTVSGPADREAWLEPA